jgi:ketosteroid isomerase-like protein
MSEENVEVVRRTLEAFQAGGIDAALKFVGDDTVWYPFLAWVEDSEYRGWEGVRKVVAIWTDNFDDFAVEVHDLRAAGDKVVALYEQSGRIRDSGVPIRQQVGGVFSDFRGGKSHQAHFFESWKEALEAAGLRE